MWEELASACCVIGAVWLCRLLWLLLLNPLVEVLWPGKLLDRLHTRAVLITGCDSGFGEGLARRLDHLGVPVFAGCLLPKGPGAQGLARDCSSRLRVLPLDVTSEQQVADAVAAVKAELSAKSDTELWGVVNNAGIGELGEIEHVPVEGFQRTFDVNTMGAVRVTKAFLPLLKKSRGRVVNVTSQLGPLTPPVTAAYGMSKIALIVFSDVLREEVKKWDVSVCAIKPGLYRTGVTNVKHLLSKYTENVNIASNMELAHKKEAIEYLGKLISGLYKMACDDITDMVDEMMFACVGRNTKNERVPRLAHKIAIAYTFILPARLRQLILDMIYKLAIRL